MIADHLSAADVGPVPGPEDPAQRRLDDEQDDGVHGLRAPVGRLRPGRDAGVGRRLGDLRRSGDVAAFADAVERLLDDPELRLAMARRARARVAQELDWRPQAEAYVGVFDELTGGAAVDGGRSTFGDADAGRWVRQPWPALCRPDRRRRVRPVHPGPGTAVGWIGPRRDAMIPR